MFVGSVLAASICGPAIGGILADRIGYRWTFAIGSSMAVLAALLAWRLLRTAQESPGPQRRPLRFRDVGVVLRNPRFLALISLGAMPAKIILTGFLYYLAPLYLAHLGNSQSATGRIMMVYGLMMVLMTPLAARTADRVGRPMLFVVLGGLFSGIGLLGVLWSAKTEMVLLGIVVLGLAQAVSITPQLSLVPVACPDECKAMGQVTVIGFFRLFERIGSALGPLLAALLLRTFDYVSAIVAIGCGVGIGCILLGLAWHFSVGRQKEPNRRRRGQASDPAVPEQGGSDELGLATQIGDCRIARSDQVTSLREPHPEPKPRSTRRRATAWRASPHPGDLS
jgi:predicted MFS family arabinose efflux permease